MPTLEIFLLDGFRVQRSGSPVTAFESVRTRALLAYLVLEADKPHTREELAALLWSERPDRTARRNLSQALNNLQSAIHNRDAQPPFLLVTPDDIQFNRASDVWVDVWEFQRATPGPGSEAALQSSVALYHDELLREFFLRDSPLFEEWLLLAREKFHQLALERLERLLQTAQGRKGAGHAEAVPYAKRILELEVWHEPAHRALIEEYVRAGNRMAALAQYETLRRVLNAELGVEPSAETNALYAQLKRGDAAPRQARVLNLPGARTPFIGRAAELAGLARRFQDRESRACTLLGPGGIGKTRLAVHFARRYAEQTGSDVCFVACEALNHADELPNALANAFGFQQMGTPQLLAALRGLDADCLLLLDNLEQVAGAGGFILELLDAAPRTRTLVTSRERLGIAGEHVIEIGGLNVPTMETRWNEADAMALLLGTARRAGRSDVETLDVEEQRAVRDICDLVDGMPLALELAGAQVRAFSFAEIASEIRHSLDFLSNAPLGTSSRHASIKTVIAQSWQRLERATQLSFARLAIFRGGFTRQAAQQVAGAELRVLLQLVDQSLLRRASNGRYTLHPLIAQFIAEHADAADGLAERHCAFYLDWVTERAGALDNRDAPRVLEEFRLDIENVRAAWVFCTANRKWEWGLRAAAGLGLFFRHGCFFQTALECFSIPVTPDIWRAALFLECADTWLRLGQSERAQEEIAQAQRLNETLHNAEMENRIELLLGDALAHQGQNDAAETHLARAIALADATGRLEIAIRARLAVTRISVAHRDWAQMIQLGTQAMGLSQRLGNHRLEAQSLSNLVGGYVPLGDYERALAVGERSLELRREVGDLWGSVRTEINIGAMLIYQTQFQQAAERFERTLLLCQEIGDRSGACIVQVNLGEAWLELGAFERAFRLARQSYALATELNLRWAMVGGLMNLATAQFWRGEWEECARVARQLLALGEASDSPDEQAAAILCLAQVACAQADWRAAQTHCERALSLVQIDENAGLEIGLGAILAYTACKQDAFDLARRTVKTVLARLDTYTPQFWLDWLWHLWLLVQAMGTLQDPRGDAVLQRARHAVEKIASQISDLSLRETYLNQSPAREILAR